MFLSTDLRFSRLVPFLGLALLVLTLPVMAAEIYQWKDAKGITHYSDAPPAGQEHKTREITSHGAKAVAATGAATPAESTECTTSRSNLKQLQGTAPIGPDMNGDGKPDREFSPDERSAQAKLAEAAISVHCPAASAAKHS